MPWSASTWRWSSSTPSASMLASSPMVAGRLAPEQPGPQLALLGPGQAHDVLGIVGRPLDEGQRLEDRVVDVGRHLRPLLGQGAGLAFRHQVADQAQPPRAEDQTTMAAITSRAPPRGRSAAALVWPWLMHDDATPPSADADHLRMTSFQRTGPALAPCRTTASASSVLVDPHPLGLAGVAPDEDRQSRPPGRPAS